MQRFQRTSGRALWILLCGLLGAGAAFALARLESKKYTATATVVFTKAQASERLAAGQLPAEPESPGAQQRTNRSLVELSGAAGWTAKRVGHGLTPDEVKQAVSVAAPADASAVSVSATSTSAVLAAEIANDYAQRFVSEQQAAERRAYRSALKAIGSQLAALSPRQRGETHGLALQARAQSLVISSALQPGTVELARSASPPSSPSSPDVLRDTIAGGVLGLLLGLGAALLLMRAGGRIRKPDDLSRIYDAPLLGAVPHSRLLARPAHRGEWHRDLLPADEAEVFHLIHAQLRYGNAERELDALLVASADAGDGKTTVARYLAAAVASFGFGVLLIDANLRRPGIAGRFGIAPWPGLSDVLSGSVSLAQAIQSVDIKLDALVAGAEPPPNPGELVGSEAMREAIKQLRVSYDLLVIDSPPLALVSDAFSLLGEVSGVLVVGRVGHSRRESAARLHETLDRCRAPLLGVVANDVRAHGSRADSYVYGYSQLRGAVSAPSLAPNGVARPADAMHTVPGSGSERLGRPRGSRRKKPAN